jgi:hypothetical protein
MKKAEFDKTYKDFLVRMGKLYLYIIISLKEAILILFYFFKAG